jgi:hypothetical protein
MQKKSQTSCFGDKRLEKKGCLEQRLLEQKSSIIHKFSANPSDSKSYYRFLNNPRVTEQEISHLMYQECASRIKNRRVVVFADTSNVLLHNKRNRIKDATGLTRISNNQYLTYQGLILHTNLVFDQDTQEALGNSHTMFIKRKPKSRAEKGEKQKRCVEAIEEKESYKWIEGFESSKKLLKQATTVTLVADREADIIELADRLPDETTDIVVRSQHNRNIIDNDGNSRKLKEVLSSSSVLGKMSISVVGNKRKKRKAKLEIRTAKVKLTWHHSKNVKEKMQELVPINVIEVGEKTHKGFKNESPLIWRILTTKGIESLAEVKEVKEVINIYKLRWKVEEYFKLLKSDCYDIENTELTKGKSIRKLILYIMKASIKHNN